MRCVLAEKRRGFGTALAAVLFLLLSASAQGQELPPGYFDFDTDPATGNRVYRTPEVQHAYLNLKRVSRLVNEVGVRAQLEFPNIEENVKASSVRAENQTLDTLLGWVEYGFGKLADWDAPFVGQIGAQVVSSLLTDILHAYTQPGQAPTDLQSEVNQTWNFLRDSFVELERSVDVIGVNLADNWFRNYTNPRTGHSMTVSDLGNAELVFPDEFDPNFVTTRDFARKEVCYAVIKDLMVDRGWQIYQWPQGWGTFWKTHYYRLWNRDDPNPKGPYYDVGTNCIDYEQVSPYGTWCGDGTLAGLDREANAIADSYTDPTALYTQAGLLSSLFLWTEDGEYYVKEWFVDDYDYRGKWVHRWFLRVDGGYAPETFSEWLFSDHAYQQGQILRPDAYAQRNDVFFHWGLPIVAASTPMVPEPGSVGLTLTALVCLGLRAVLRGRSAGNNSQLARPTGQRPGVDPTPSAAATANLL